MVVVAVVFLMGDVGASVIVAVYVLIVAKIQRISHHHLALFWVVVGESQALTQGKNKLFKALEPAYYCFGKVLSLAFLGCPLIP